MPRKPQQPAIACQYFMWQLFRRAGVYFADGRGAQQHLGKHSLGTRDYNKAIATLKELDIAKAKERGLVADVRISDDFAVVSIKEGWVQFLDFSGRSPVMGGTSVATQKRYRAVRDKHVAFCHRSGIKTWNDFTVSALEKYGNALGKSKADRTVYLELTLVKSINGWLIKKKRLPESCKLDYSLTKPKGTDTYCYSTIELVAMVEHCQRSPKLVWLANVIVALAHTGLRISELAGLRWSDINLQQDVLLVADERASCRKKAAGTARATKGRRSRTIPIHPVLKKLLTTLPRNADGYVFRAALGGRIRTRNILQLFIERVIEPLTARFSTAEGEIGFEHGRLHSFRHFFCSQAFLGGASEGEIKEWLGHADSKMVEHYRHLRGDDAQRKMGKINFLGDQNGQAEES